MINFRKIVVKIAFGDNIKFLKFSNFEGGLAVFPLSGCL